MLDNDKYIRKDIIYFNLSMVFIMAIIVVVLLYAPSIGFLNMFIPAALVIFNIILTYNIGLQRGLMVGLILTFSYGTYILYETIVINRIYEVSFAYISWLFFYPLSSLLSGKLAATVADYKRELASKKKLERLVTIDTSTGFYNQQGFFKKLDEEFLRAKRYKTYFSILIIKICNFDQLVIIYGELDSIKILQTVANKVVEQTRCSDIKSIIENNMLSIVLNETNEDGAKVVVEKLHQVLDSISIDIRGVRKVIRIKPSIGISGIRESDSDSFQIYTRAKEELNYDKC